jgi:hypothetical protein
MFSDATENKRGAVRGGGATRGKGIGAWEDKHINQ